MEIVHERAPLGFEKIEDVITTRELDGLAQRYKELPASIGIR